MTNFTTMTAFGGADLIVVVNKKIIGEAQAIHYKENLLAEEGEPKFDGRVDIVVFNEEPVLRGAIREQEHAGFYLRYANEYGQQMLVQFTNVKFLERIGTSSVDLVVVRESYTFVADDMLYYEDGQFTFDFETNEVTIHETI